MGAGNGHPKQTMKYVKMVPQDLPQRPLHYQPPLKRRKGNSCCCCLSTCCCILFTMVVLLFVLALVVWLTLNPKAPTVALQQAKVNTLDLNANITSRTFILNADIAFTVQITNPNTKIAILYDKIDIATSYSGSLIAQASVPAFVQGTQNMTVITSDLTTANLLLTETLGNALDTDIKNNAVPLFVQVAVNARVSIPSWHYTSFSFTIMVKCDVRVSPPSAPQGAKMLSKTCSVSGS